MTALADLRDLVELDLDDSSNAVFSTGDVDRGIERALRDYSVVNPQRVVGTITLAADGREVSLSTLTGLTQVARVWYPYTSTDPEDPPEWRRWERWSSTLYILDGDEPASGEVVRVYYHKQHTIDGLNSESTTTVPISPRIMWTTRRSFRPTTSTGSPVVPCATATMRSPGWISPLCSAGPPGRTRSTTQ